jgi:predicted HicB family RNase H-like nuclease
MAKDPAVLFYTSDFLSGTFTMSNEHVGMYIRLLCLQHQKGVLSEKDMLSICKAYVEEVYSKFEKKDTGFVNIRMQEESERRKRFSDSRRKNAQSGNNQDIIPKNQKSTSKAYAKHMETETENETITDTKAEKEKAKIQFLNPFGDSFTGWQGWKDYKKEEHGERYKAVKTEQMAINKLFELSNGNKETALAIIKQSIENRWKGLFELKTNNNGSTKAQPASTLRERVTAEFNKRYGNGQ